MSTWEKPGATEEEERQIYKRCIYEAESNAEIGIVSDFDRKERIRKLRDMCLEANGMVLIKREIVPTR